MANQESTGKAFLIQGRIVWVSGDLFKGRVKTVFGSNQPALDKDGKQQQEYGFGLAVDKGQFAPGLQGDLLFKGMQEQTFEVFPSRQVPPGFAWKYKDGDTGVDDKGAPMNLRKGYPGNIVFSMLTRIAPKFFIWQNGAYVQVSDGIKCGDYVQVQVQVKAQVSAKPGLYLNPSSVLFLGYGEEIINSPSPDQIFGSQAPQMPMGASATPVGVSAPMPGMPGQQAPQMQQPAYQQPMQQAPQQVQPHYAVLPQAHQPQGQPPMGNVPNSMPQSAPPTGFPQNGYPAPVSAPAAAPGYPVANQQYPAAAPTAAPGFQQPAGMAAPTGYPQAAAPMGAYPGSPQMPGFPR